MKVLSRAPAMGQKTSGGDYGRRKDEGDDQEKHDEEEDFVAARRAIVCGHGRKPNGVKLRRPRRCRGRLPAEWWIGPVAGPRPAERSICLAWVHTCLAGGIR